MLKEQRGAVTNDDSRRNGLGWKVIRTVGPCRRFSGEGLNSLQNRPHLRMVRGALNVEGSQAKERENLLPRERSTSTRTHGGPMAKRQRQERRDYTDDTRPGEAPGLEPSVDVPTIAREFYVTQAADDTLQDVIRLLSRATGTNISNSHFLRVLLKAVAHAMPEIKKEAYKVGKLKRPSNSRSGQAEREEYERALANVVVAAIQNSPSPADPGTGDQGKGSGPGKRSA